MRGQAARRLGVERCALAHAEAVLLVDHAERQPGELDGRLDQGVGAHHQPELARGQPVEAVSRRREAGVDPVSRREAERLGRRAAGRGSRRAARRGSRWAPSAPPGGRPRELAASRTARPRSCPTRPPPSAAAASARRRRDRASISANALRWSPVGSKGSEASHRSTSAPERRASRPGSFVLRPCAAGGERPPGSRKSSSKASRLRASPASLAPAGKCTARQASAAPARRAAARSSAGSGSITSPALASACQTHSLIRCGRSPSVAGWTGTRPVVWIPDGGSPPPPPSRNSCSETRNPRRSSVADQQQSRRRARSRSASQGWLNQTAPMRPAGVGDRRLDDASGRGAGSAAAARSGPRPSPSPPRRAGDRPAAAPPSGRCGCGEVRSRRSPSVSIPTPRRRSPRASARLRAGS